MNGSTQLPSLETLKSQAKQLRAALETAGTLVSHSRSLELLATQLGFRDWNTLHAAVGNQPPPPPFSLGQRASGSYLGQQFSGEVISVTTHQSTGRYHVTFLFGEAVNVVRFEGMTNFRKRVSCNLDEIGKCVAKTSDGVPHFVFDT